MSTWRVNFGNGQVQDVGGMSRYNGRVMEMGNGFPAPGDYVPDNEGGLLRVIALGRIETGRSPGASNWCLAELEPADWGDCPEGEEHSSCAGLDDEDEDNWEGDGTINPEDEAEEE